MKRFLTWLTKKEKLHFASFLIIVSIVGTLYLRLGRDPLFNWDEGIYAQLGVEALELGHWFTPTWNQQLWLEKPPAIAWITALGMKWKGMTALGARVLMPVVAGLVLVFTYLIGYKIKDGWLGVLAVLILANMNLFLSRARAVNTDEALLAGIVAVVYFGLLGTAPIWIALAVAWSVWFKGVAGLLALVIVLPLLISRGRRYLLRVIGYLLALVLPWHIYQFWAHGEEFVRPYLGEQVLRRLTIPIEFHLESRWFYFKYLYQDLGIGRILLLLMGMGLIMARILQVVKKQPTLDKLRRLKAEITLVWWIVFPLTLFTLAKTRLFWYILPIYPAVALVIALWLGNLSERNIVAKKTLWVFLPLYFLFTLKQVSHHVDFQRSETRWPDRVSLAREVSSLSKSGLAVLVPAHERLAQAILPEEQRISSSFRYGGAPNLVFYSQQPVRYFYKFDELQQALGEISWLIIHRDDYAKLNLPESRIIKEAGDYLLVEINHEK